MNVYEREISDLLKDSEELEAEIGLPSGFLRSLNSEDDWSFVIKSTVLIEAVISTWLVDHLQQSELKKPLSYIDIGNPRYGKLELVNALGLTTSFDRKFLKTVIELRNNLAHRIENISFNFDSYVSSLDSNQRKQFGRSISYVYIDESDTGEAIYPPVDEILSSAKNVIYIGVVYFMAIIGNKIRSNRSERDLEILRVKILEKEAKLRKLQLETLGLEGLQFRDSE